MLALIAELSPLRDVVRSAVEDVDLTVGAIGSHDILFDRFSDPDLFDQVVQWRLFVLPFLGGDNLNDSRLHAVTVYFFHLCRDV